MSDYILEANNCLLDVTYNNVRYSFIEIPKKLWDDLSRHPKKYIILGYDEKGNAGLFIDSFHHEWNIKFGEDFVDSHIGWVIDYQTYNSRYFINLKYLPLNGIYWLKGIKTLVFKSINSLDSSCLKIKETLSI